MPDLASSVIERIIKQETKMEKKKPSWMFWALAPFFILCVLVLTLYAYIQGETIFLMIVLVLNLLCIFGFLSFLNPIRFRWAVRGAGLTIFLIYVAYLVYMLIEGGGKFTISSRTSDTTVFNALMGLLVFGLPGIMVAITGKLPFFFKESEEEQMSFDVFVHFFEDGEAEPVSINDLRSVYAPYVTEESDNVWRIVYNELNSSDLYLGEVNEEGKIGGFCIERPCADERLWKSIFKCLSLGNCVIYWPGLEGLLSNRAEVSKHVPEDMLGSLGTVRVVSDYKEILRILEEE